MSLNSLVIKIWSLMARTRKFSAKRAALEEMRVDVFLGEGKGHSGPEAKESLRRLLSSMVLNLHRRGRPKKMKDEEIFCEV